MGRSRADEARILRRIDILEGMASEILSLKKKSFSRRPIVIEFCGSPKAGKTSCINSLDIFLRRNNFRTKILPERASVCPIRNKFDPLFNIWSSCAALAQLSEMISNHSRNYDLVLLDRGIFDALCWFEWARDEGYLRQDDFDRFVGFFTAIKWRSLLDIVFLFSASPETSMDREYRNLLTRKEGSVMRPRVLNGYREAGVRAVKKYGSLFRSVLEVDTSEKDQNDVSYEVTERCLNRLHEVTKETVGYFPRSALNGSGKHDVFKFARVKAGLAANLKFDDRGLVEKNIGLVQPLPAALVKDKESFRFLQAKKRQNATSEQSPEIGKLLLYFGGHVRDEDSVAADSSDVNAILKQALCREIKEELGLDIDLGDVEPLCIWVRDGTRSDQHIAFIYVIQRDLDHLKLYIDEREFVRTGKDSTGSLIGGEELGRRVRDLDDWSSRALRTLFPKEFEAVQALASEPGLFGAQLKKRGHVRKPQRARPVG